MVKIPQSKAEDRVDYDWPTDPSEAVSKLRRPSTIRFRRLTAELERANQALEAGDDELRIVLRCVVAVIDFLDADQVSQGTGLSRPFGILATALRDRELGAKPSLFFDRPKKGRGRPTGTSFEAARGAIAAAAAALIGWGEKRGDAGKFVASELKHAGLRLPDGKAITARHVLTWRDEIDTAASRLAKSTFNDASARYAKIPHNIADHPEARRRFVVGVLMAVRSTGF